MKETLIKWDGLSNSYKFLWFYLYKYTDILRKLSIDIKNIIPYRKIQLEVRLIQHRVVLLREALNLNIYRINYNLILRIKYISKKLYFKITTWENNFKFQKSRQKVIISHKYLFKNFFITVFARERINWKILLKFRQKLSLATVRDCKITRA